MIPIWDEYDQSYWFDCAYVEEKLSILPRTCPYTGKSLWFKKSIKGITEYATRSRYCTDVRWMDREYYLERRNDPTSILLP